MYHPPDDRGVTSGAVVAAWAIVGGLAAMTLFASALVPPATAPAALTLQATAHPEGCADETETPDGLNGSSRD
jgi:hypothetical protein